jgi:hypothetical protein
MRIPERTADCCDCGGDSSQSPRSAIADIICRRRAEEIMSALGRRITLASVREGSAAMGRAWDFPVSLDWSAEVAIADESIEQP